MALVHRGWVTVDGPKRQATDRAMAPDAAQVAQSQIQTRHRMTMQPPLAGFQKRKRPE